MKFLPTTKEEMRAAGWKQLDVIFLTADAYCDHPSFGIALVSRLLEAEGYKVGVIAQPDWRRNGDFLRLGAPRLFFGVTAGNLDSMLNIYTSYLNFRKTDKYSPGGTPGLRPKLPTIVYTNKIKELFPGVAIVIGGVEASLRRLAYYDFWSDKVRPSILFDAKADILVYGMGERPVTEIAERLKRGEKIEALKDIRGTVVACRDASFVKDAVLLPSFEEVAQDKAAFLEAFRRYSRELNPMTARPVLQKTQSQFCLQLPPAWPLSESELDRIYGLGFTRLCHPGYEKFGGVPALETVETSLTSHRGCAASCSFCSLSIHQGRIIQSRSVASLAAEATIISSRRDFKGVISDVGGPTANMYAASCALGNRCSREDCLWPRLCPHFKIDGQKQMLMLRSLRRIAGVRRVHIQSGLRYDLLLEPSSAAYLQEICRHHVSGQLKIAPEHASDKILRLMHKPDFRVYEKFVKAYEAVNRETGRTQFLAQYFITSHPGCGENEAQELARFAKTMGYRPEQVQDFIPLPMTASSVMYHTGRDPATGEALYVPRGRSERRRQREAVQCRVRDSH